MYTTEVSTQWDKLPLTTFVFLFSKKQIFE